MPIDEALWYRRFGPPVEALTLETAERGALRPGSVRVRMIAAPINPSDLVPITGAYAHRVRPPRVAGYEGVGRVVEADPASARLVGRRVLPLRGPGTWGRYIDCDPSWLVEVPDDLETTVAARAYINPLAAHLMLRTWPVEGRRVVLTGGGSSCARLLGRWAIEAGAHEVVAVHRSVAHADALREIGLISLTMDDPPAIASAASRADVVFDAVGGALADALLAALPKRSDFVSYGLLSGESYRPRSNGPNLQRFHLRDRLAGVAPEAWQDWFRILWPRLRRTPMLATCSFPLADWRQALAAFDQPGRPFKPILAMD